MSKQSIFLSEGIKSKEVATKAAMKVLEDVKMDFELAGMDTAFIDKELSHPESFIFPCIG